MADESKWLSRNLSKSGSLDAMIDRQTGAVYYVGSGGSDRNDGLTWTNRRLTIASGYSLCTNGDTLLIGAGTFTEDLTLDTDGVAVIGVGDGNGTTLGGTLISGSHTVTAGSNIFKDIGFYDLDTAAVMITLGNDANSDYNQFIDCSIVAEGTCTVGIHIDGTAGGANNTFKNCYFSQGDTACLVLDTGAVINTVIDNCVFFVDVTANGHGIHLNHATVSGSIIKNCIVNGGGSTGTGIYIQAGDGNYVSGCSVEDCTTLYNIAATNYTINCHEESQITAGNTIQDDFSSLDSLIGNVLSKEIGTGTVFYVDSAAADDTGDGLTSATAKQTIDAGVNLCTANNGDVVLVYASGGAAFDENTNTGGVLMDTTGVTLLGVNKPLIANSNGAATAIISITAARCTVKGLYLNDAAIIGISLDGAGDDYCVIADNIIWGDMTVGIYMNDTDWNQIYGNHIAEMGTATRAGIKISGSSRSNRIIDNWIDNTDYGIWINAGTQTQNLLWRNSIGGSSVGTDKGIYIDGAGAGHTEIKDNSITNCVTAIDDSGTSTDIAGNTYGDSVDDNIIEVSITAAANAGITTVATVTNQSCLIESIIIHADAAQHADMTSCAVEGGVNQVVEFIGAGVAIQASLDAADKQVSWTGAVRLDAGKLIYIDLQGTGATAVNLTITIKYSACVGGGYLV